MRISRDLAIIERVDGVELLQWDDYEKKTNRIKLTFEEFATIENAIWGDEEHAESL